MQLRLLLTVFSTVVFAFLLTANSASAAVTILGVDESRVSSVEGVGDTSASTAGVVIYGGLAGSVSTCTSSTSTCNNCFASTGGDAGLVPCNERRINPNLRLLIRIKSDSVAGYPKLVVQNTAGTQVNLPLANTPGLVPPNTETAIEVLWSQICNNLTFTGTTTSAPNCVLPDGFGQAKLYAGVSVANDSDLATGDDSKELTIVVKALASPSLASSTDGITQFKMISGDKKGTVSELETGAGSSFPSTGFTSYRWLRLLFEKRTTPNTVVWPLINAGSPHADLEIVNDASSFNVSPVRIEGGGGLLADGVTSVSVPIDNDQIYDFKIAAVDRARNVGLYTPAANDQVCKSTLSNSPTTGPECHTIRPSEVAGVLAEKVNCFVASAAYGSPMASEVSFFRAFRDQYLVPTKLGKDFVRFYYKKGPIAAHFIHDNDTLRFFSRGLLWGPLQFAKVSVNYGLLAAFALLALLCFSPVAVWMTVRRFRSSKTHA